MTIAELFVINKFIKLGSWLEKCVGFSPIETSPLLCNMHFNLQIEHSRVRLMPVEHISPSSNLDLYWTPRRHIDSRAILDKLLKPGEDSL